MRRVPIGKMEVERAYLTEESAEGLGRLKEGARGNGIVVLDVDGYVVKGLGKRVEEAFRRHGVLGEGFNGGNAGGEGLGACGKGWGYPREAGGQRKSRGNVPSLLCTEDEKVSRYKAGALRDISMVPSG